MDFDKRKVQLGVLIMCIVVGTVMMIWPSIAALVIYDRFLPEMAKVLFVGSNIDSGMVAAIMNWSIIIGSIIVGIGYLIFNQSPQLRRLLKGIFLVILIYLVAYGIFFIAGAINYTRF